MSHGPAINQNMLLLSLKQVYVHVFLGNMESDIMEKARLAGFLPVFLIKNAYLQRSAKFGLNGYQVSTMDMHPKSFLLLVAFYKGKLENDTLEIITLTNKEKQFMVLPNSKSWTLPSLPSFHHAYVLTHCITFLHFNSMCMKISIAFISFLAYGWMYSIRFMKAFNKFHSFQLH